VSLSSLRARRTRKKPISQVKMMSRRLRRRGGRSASRRRKTL
jgi:hypothetical protein